MAWRGVAERGDGEGEGKGKKKVEVGVEGEMKNILKREELKHH